MSSGASSTFRRLLALEQAPSLLGFSPQACLSLSLPPLSRPLTMQVPLSIAAAPGIHAAADVVPRRHPLRTNAASTAAAVVAIRRRHRPALRIATLQYPTRLSLRPAASDGGSDTVDRGERRARGQWSGALGATKEKHRRRLEFFFPFLSFPFSLLINPPHLAFFLCLSFPVSPNTNEHTHTQRNQKQ